MRHGGNVWQGAPESWLDFSASLRPEGPPSWAMEAMRRALRQARYYPDPAMKRATEGIAAWLGVPEARVLPMAGGMAALDLALSRRRGRVYTQFPTFGEYAARAAVRGRETAPWQGDCRAGETLVLCNPCNPTGHALSREEVLALYQAVARQGGELLVDEAFAFCCPEVSVARVERPGLIVAGSLTKALCVPGIRLGYLCADGETIRALRALALPWQLSAPASALAEELPGHRAELAEDVSRNEGRREAFRAALEDLGAKVSPSRANFLLCDFGRDMEDARARLRARGILVRGCASFSLPPSVWRLSVRTEEENARLIEELRTALA